MILALLARSKFTFSEHVFQTESLEAFHPQGDEAWQGGELVFSQFRILFENTSLPACKRIRALDEAGWVLPLYFYIVTQGLTPTRIVVCPCASFVIICVRECARQGCMDHRCPRNHDRGKRSRVTRQWDRQQEAWEKYLRNMEEGPWGLDKSGRTSWGREHLTPGEFLPRPHGRPEGSIKLRQLLPLGPHKGFCLSASVQ